MALLYISEYSRVATDSHGQPVATGLEASYDQVPVSIGIGSVLSAQLKASTKFVRLNADTTFSFVCGDANVVATTDNKRVPANGTEFFGISPAVTHIAVIANS